MQTDSGCLTPKSYEILVLKTLDAVVLLLRGLQTGHSIGDVVS